MYYSIYDHYRIKSFKPKGKKPILIRILNPNSDNEPLTSFEYIDTYQDVLELCFIDHPNQNICESSEYYFNLKDMKKK